MVTHSYGFGFNRFRGSPIVEPGRRSSGADLDHRVVRGDNRRAGHYFWLALAELADANAPRDRQLTARDSVLSRRIAGLVPSLKLLARPALFFATNFLAFGLLKNNAAWCG